MIKQETNLTLIKSATSYLFSLLQPWEKELFSKIFIADKNSPECFFKYIDGTFGTEPKITGTFAALPPEHVRILLQRRDSSSSLSQLSELALKYGFEKKSSQFSPENLREEDLSNIQKKLHIFVVLLAYPELSFFLNSKKIPLILSDVNQENDSYTERDVMATTTEKFIILNYDRCTSQKHIFHDIFLIVYEEIFHLLDLTLSTNKLLSDKIDPKFVKDAYNEVKKLAKLKNEFENIEDPEISKLIKAMKKKLLQINPSLSDSQVNIYIHRIFAYVAESFHIPEDIPDNIAVTKLESFGRLAASIASLADILSCTKQELFKLFDYISTYLEKKGLYIHDQKKRTPFDIVIQSIELLDNMTRQTDTDFKTTNIDLLKVFYEKVVGLTKQI